MAFDANTQWDIRTTGSDSNGGGFAYGLGAKDVTAATDLVIDATNAKKVTAAGHNFVSGDVGKYLHVTAGTAWRPGYYQIISAAANAATLDVSPTYAGNSNHGTYDLYAAIDYAQQDAAQISYTDMVIDGATNTKFTSAANPVTDAHVGNIINVTSGTGFTVQRVQIISQAAGVATCDKALGTVGSTGGNGALGGALLTLNKATNTAIMVTGNMAHIKAGTYTLTASWQLDPTGATSGMLAFKGYQTNHHDGGTRPLITTATNSTKLLYCCASPLFFENLNFSNTATVRADGMWASGTTYQGPTLINCTLDGFVVGLNGDNGAGGASGYMLTGVEIKNCTSDGIRSYFQTYMQGCFIHDNAGNGWQGYSTSAPLSASQCIFAKNGGYGAGSGSAVPLLIFNCTFAGNTSHGLGSTAYAAPLVVNSIFDSNGGYGIANANNSVVGYYEACYRNNAFRNNTSGMRYSSTPNHQVYGDIILSADPFTNSSGNDYSLNDTAGGGAACKGKGYQWGA